MTTDMTKKWAQLDLVYLGIFSSLWLFPRRGEGGDAKFHGNFVPQVVERLIAWLTEPEDFVFDPMAGSGTTYDVAKRLGRIPLVSDLTPVRPEIWPADARYAVPVQIAPHLVTNSLYGIRPTKSAKRIGDKPLQAQLLVMHPPYHDIVQFSDNPDDLSNCSNVAHFLELMYAMALHLDQFVARMGYVGLVMGNIYKGGEGLIPLSFLTMQIWRARLPNYQLRSIIVKDIQGNVQGSGDPGYANLRKSRHARHGTSQFMTEDIYVFKKLRDRKATD